MEQPGDVEMEGLARSPTKEVVEARLIYGLGNQLTVCPGPQLSLDLSLPASPTHSLN